MNVNHAIQMPTRKIQLLAIYLHMPLIVFMNTIKILVHLLTTEYTPPKNANPVRPFPLGAPGATYFLKRKCLHPTPLIIR